MQIVTSLSASEYEKFKAKAQKLGISKYALAKEGVLSVINETQEETALRQILRVAKDIFETKYHPSL